MVEGGNTEVPVKIGTVQRTQNRIVDANILPQQGQTLNWLLNQQTQRIQEKTGGIPSEEAALIVRPLVILSLVQELGYSVQGRERSLFDQPENTLTLQEQLALINETRRVFRIDPLPESYVSRRLVTPEQIASVVNNPDMGNLREVQKQVIDPGRYTEDEQTKLVVGDHEYAEGSALIRERAERERFSEWLTALEITLKEKNK